VAGGGRKNADEVLIAQLAAGATRAAAAEAAGVSERTVFRRWQDREFRRRVAIARTALVSNAVGQLADAAAEAVQTLRSLLRSESDNVRLGAARSILELGPRLRESEELAARLDILEATIDGDELDRERAQWQRA
jgi:hypothetical protein